MDDLGLHGVEHLADARGQQRRRVGVRERRGNPVVDHFDHGQTVVLAPGQVAVRAAWVVLGAEQRHVVTRAQLAAELGGVNLGTRTMSRQEIVNGLKDAQTPHGLTVARLVAAGEARPCVPMHTAGHIDRRPPSRRGP